MSEKYRGLVLALVSVLSVGGSLHVLSPLHVSGQGPAGPVVGTVSEEDEETADFCAMRVLRKSPLVTIPISALAVDAVIVHVETGFYTVTVPLRKPQGHIEAVFVGAKNLQDASVILGFLESRKLKAVNVLTHRADFRSDAKPTDAERQLCEPDQLKDSLAQCTQCRIREFLFGKKRR